MAKIALIGASGQVGSRILLELSDRGHLVTAIARDPLKIAAMRGVTAKKGDIFREDSLTPLLEGHDAVISSVHFLDSDAYTLIASVLASGVKRYLIVGGAGSLYVEPGVRLMETPEFPALYKREAEQGAEFLDVIKEVEELEWTFISPSANFFAGSRTGNFRIGDDSLLSSADGSSVSFEDFAVAMVDEIENPRHVRKRFTVGY